MSSELTLTEASEMLTIGETKAIEKHYGKPLESDDLSGTDQLSGVIWAMERRKPRNPGDRLYNWDDVDALTLKQANDYFAPEPIETDEAEPETEAGKDDSADE